MNRTLFYSLLRQFLYLITLTIVVFIFWKIGDTFKSATVQEYGIFETMQSIVLGLIAVSFGFQAYHNKDYRPILFSLSMLALAALVREQDAYLDKLIPYIGWTWCWLFPISGLIYLIRSRRTIRAAMETFLKSNSFHMMVTAVIIIIPIAQCLGHRSFLADLLGDTKINTFLVRRILEEPIELIGYIQILLASVESSLELRKK